MDQGPVEVLFVTFPVDQDINGVAAALRRPADHGAVSVIDLVLLERGPDGAVQLHDVEEEASTVPALAGLTVDPHRLLSDLDLEVLADSLPSDHQGIVVVVEQVWARGLVNDLSGLEAEIGLFAHIPAETVKAAYDFEDALTS